MSWIFIQKRAVEISSHDPFVFSVSYTDAKLAAIDFHTNNGKWVVDTRAELFKH